MAIEDGVRPIEEGVKTDFSAAMDYGSYLALDALLSAQRPISDHHDEPLFIIQHQTTELWLKLALHELRAVRSCLDADDVRRARKGLARVKHIFRTITEQWSVLATLTPSEYAEFRGVLGNASGFQSYQYRAVEFILGNKNGRVLKVFESKPEIHDMHPRHAGRDPRLADGLRLLPPLPRAHRSSDPEAGSGPRRAHRLGGGGIAPARVQGDLRGHRGPLGRVRRV
jgi:tryptophan 2,3-dioxygenase